MTIIIPSKTAENLRQCMAALRICEPHAKLFVVDDGLADRPAGASYLNGIKPFCFPRNVNIGMRAALESGEQWIGVWNDDALIRTPGGLSLMISEWPMKCGIAAPSCTNTGNRNQWPHGSGGWRPEPRMVCFTAALFHRGMIEQIGLLDERFAGYGWDDNDYCRRARQAGWEIWIDDRCVVEHHILPSTFRGDPRAGGNIWANAEIYRAKWGNLE